MRPLIPHLTSLLVLCAVTSAHAAGTNLRWDACFGDAGVSNKNFACTTNVGTNTLVASFVLPVAENHANGFIALMDVASAAATLPAWWQVSSTLGDCRFGQLGNSAIPPAGAVACEDWMGGQFPAVNPQATYGVLGANTVRLRFYDAAPAGVEANLLAGKEYFAATLILRRTKTVGIGSCSGCATAACIALNSISIVLVGNPTPEPPVTGPANGSDSDFVTWQGGAGVPPLPGGACPAAVPTRSSTWGSVKALYR